METCGTEEPDEGNPHVRICGGIGRAIADSTWTENPTTVLIPGESRNWVKYSPGMLLVALLGRIILGFGTRLGPGCTTHHIFGGLAVMSVASLTIAMVGMSFAFLAFEFVAKLGRFHRNEAYQRCCRAADRCDTECDTESMVFGTESCKILRIVHA